MKRFMQLALASFGVLSLMLAGCNSTTTSTDTTSTTTDGTTVEGTTTDTGSTETPATDETTK